MLKRAVSPLYTFRNPEFRGTWVIDIDQKPYRKYKPYNYVMVTNQSAYDVELVINGGTRKKVASNTVMEMDSATIPAIHHIMIRSGANLIEAGSIEVAIQKQLTFRDLWNAGIRRLQLW